jgi:hypothetical protein
LDKINASFSSLQSYARLLAIFVSVYHLHSRISHNALQAFIKFLLTEALKATQSANDDELNWQTYLLQHVIFSMIQTLFESYGKGIHESIKSGADHFFVPDEVFQFGQPLLHNLIKYKPQLKPFVKIDLP